MKIDIITCHTPLNYGAQLQAYALQTYLEQDGNEAEIIDYAPDYYLEELRYSYVGDKRYHRNLLLRVATILVKFPAKYLRKHNFSRFQDQHLHLTRRRYRCYEELLGETPIADKYICGSDQIWNTRGTRGYSPAFYLDFVKDSCRRASYAASMALDLPVSERVKRDVIPLINKLEFVSVRERNIAEALQPLVNKHIYHVLDPVFLLDKSDWLKLASEAKPFRKDYILVYPMGNADITIRNAKVLAEMTGLPIYCISGSQKHNKAVTKYFDCTIPAFLQLFLCAKYIVTNSFHGTSFSIIFRKSFWTCQSHNNNRLSSLLVSLGLEQRFVANDTIVSPDKALLEIDYKQVAGVLNASIEHSKMFLKNYLQQEIL